MLRYGVWDGTFAKRAFDGRPGAGSGCFGLSGQGGPASTSY